MFGLLIAALLFAGIVGIVASLRADDDSVQSLLDHPRKVPNPGPRDLHTVTSATLGRAHVPSWG